MEADLKARRGESYAIIRDPKSVVEGLAARFLSSISAEERVQLRGYTNAFCERIKTTPATKCPQGLCFLGAPSGKTFPP
jgi:hypothetical protein